MRCIHQFLFVGLAWVSAVALASAVSKASVVWDESANGNLSSSGATPTAITLGLGTNSILGTVGGSAQQDWVALTIPAGEQLSNLVLAAYQSADAQGFTGVFTGGSFSGSVNTPSNYLGYAHFGTGATNTGLPVTNLIGADILPIMGNTANAPGSHGFTPPLPAGTYTFLIQQLGASTTYQFDYDTTVAPEPVSLGLLTLVAPMLVRRRSN